MSKKKIKAEKYNNYEKTIMFDLGESKGKFDKTYMTPLQALDFIKNARKPALGMLENELEIIETALKALEIIKSKKVNVRAFLKSCYYKDSNTQLNVYNSQCCDWQEMESKELTQEEYDFLKEILK